jgi:glucokinase
LDVGNTRLTAAVVNGRGETLAHWEQANPRAEGAAAGLAALQAMVARAREQAPEAAAIGIGFGGPVDLSTGLIRRSHHTSGWEGVALAEVLGAASGLPAYLDNDANAGGLGEALFGAGRGVDSLLYVNVGTGIGGAVIIGGHIHHGAHSNAGEIGHVVVTLDFGPVCTCGKLGCLEAWASGDALGAAARQAADEGRLAGSSLAATAAEDLTGRSVATAASAGDAAALAILQTAGRYLGVALAAAANVLDPALVVVGGGVSEGNPPYLEAARQSFAACATPPVAAGTAVVPALLGYQAGVVGAAAIALQALNAVE